ncbi:uncharacterized protein LOC113469454 [Diaphorina citri]|uniref:Uncharacterized protein LOC113469454 n=1 Tax=Diaphorina citri TaxID=121845 RepID=A0A3Q0J8C0_DIACI|nr:uncharacterized protein LOC113469454 [Diaphorina citri]
MVHAACSHDTCRGNLCRRNLRERLSISEICSSGGKVMQGLRRARLCDHGMRACTVVISLNFGRESFQNYAHELRLSFWWSCVDLVLESGIDDTKVSAHTRLLQAEHGVIPDQKCQ